MTHRLIVTYLPLQSPQPHEVAAVKIIVQIAKRRVWERQRKLPHAGDRAWVCALLCPTPSGASSMTQGYPPGRAQSKCGLVGRVGRHGSGARHGAPTGAVSLPRERPPMRISQRCSEDKPAASLPGRSWARALCAQLPRRNLTEEPPDEAGTSQPTTQVTTCVCVCG